MKFIDLKVGSKFHIKRYGDEEVFIKSNEKKRLNAREIHETKHFTCNGNTIVEEIK